MYGVGFFHQFSDLHLDIVGIVAILGEGSTSRNAQASSLSWHHILPRIYPAPQALLLNHRKTTFPVEPGIVMGALSGKIRTELNFFTQLLHQGDLPEYGVELVEVSRRTTEDDDDDSDTSDSRILPPAFDVKKRGHLAGLSVLGCCMSLALLGLSVWQHDGPALLATLLLSATSSCVGLASWCKLDKGEEVPFKDRKKTVPLGDVIIYYPSRAAFRVVRCTDQVSRLYFRWEKCEQLFNDNSYRTIALFSTVLLMSGLILLGNSGANMQAGFAMSYILLNAFYWASSALDPATHVWQHDFDIRPLGFTTQMITKADGSIVPQQSELSPVSADKKADPTKAAKIIDNSHEYYRRGHWMPRKVKRVFTVEAIRRPGKYAHREQEKPPNFLSFMWLKSKIRSNTFRGAEVSVPMNTIALMKSASNQQTPKYKRTFTSALWTVIALTGSSRWARSGHIAPDNNVWNLWLKEAEEMATGRWSRGHREYVPACTSWIDVEGKQWVQLPHWRYQERLSELFAAHTAAFRERWESPTAVEDMERKIQLLRSKFYIFITFRVIARRIRSRRQGAVNNSPIPIQSGTFATGFSFAGRSS